MSLDGSQQVIVEEKWVQDPNTPILSFSYNLDDEALIRPLKREKLRDRLMPATLNLNKQTSKSGDLLAPTRKASNTDNKRATSALAMQVAPIDVISRKEESKKDEKIMDLQMQVNSLKKENMDLRLMLNYFMQLSFKNN